MVNVEGWEKWEFNKRGELYHVDQVDLVFTSQQLVGLHWHFQVLADERGQLRDRIRELESAIERYKQAIPQRSHIVDTHIHGLPINCGLYVVG